MANVINYILMPASPLAGGSTELVLSAAVNRVGQVSAWPFSTGGSSATRPTTGQQWPRGFGSAGVFLSDLGNLSDVELGALAANQVLVYDPGSGKWINRAWRITHYNDSCSFTGPTDTHDFTITAVDTARSFVIPTASSPPGSTVALSGFVNSTTVRFVLNAGSSPQLATVNFYVIELP